MDTDHFGLSAQIAVDHPYRYRLLGRLPIERRTRQRLDPVLRILKVHKKEYTNNYQIL